MTTATEQISYSDLYARWERGNWRATEIDFSEDREHWRERFSDFERKAALWNYAMFLHGEDSVAVNLAPFIDAAPHEEQKYFLTTQQVDEARHAVFFGRFFSEVVEVGGDLGSSLEATRPELTWGFRQVFGRLDRMSEELRRDPSRTKLAQAVTLYHIVIEATLAQPGQHFIEAYLEDRDVLPGFREGMRNVSLDEQRHIGFGVKLLSDLVAEDPECKDAVAELLRETVNYSLGVFVPPDWDRRYAECFGFTLEDIYEYGAISFDSKLRAAGLPVEDLPGLAYPHDLPPRQRAERALRLLQAGLVGEKVGPPARDPEAIAMLFDSVRRAVDPRRAPAGTTTIQWDFSDAEPWFLRLDNGSTVAEQGRLEEPDVTLRCRFEDWVDVAAGRQDPRRAMATGRLRPRGNLRALWQTRRLFAR
jgi:hypothetical protein